MQKTILALALAPLLSAYAHADLNGISSLDDEITEKTAIHYGDRKGERELFGYNPDFTPAAVSFAPDGTPYMRQKGDNSRRPRDKRGIGAGTALRTINADGEWEVRDIYESIQNLPEGKWADSFRNEIIFDADGDAYLLVDGTGQDGVWTWLLHSKDSAKTWTAYSVPIPKIPETTHPDFPQHTTRHMRPIIERKNSANLDKYPPVILSSDGEYLLLVTTTKDANGDLVFDEPVQVENITDDWKAPIDVIWAGDWGNWGNKFVMHDVAVSQGDKVHLFWARPWPVEGQMGTPMYAATYDRSTGEVSEPVFMGANGFQIDGHNRPAAVIDDKGYLHVILGCHATIQHPHDQLTYVRSLEPGTTAAGFTKPEMLPIPARGTYWGEPGGTGYPSIAWTDDGTMHVIGRQYDIEASYTPGIYTTPDDLLLTRSRLAYYRKPEGKPWEYRYLVRNFHPEYSLWFHNITRADDSRIAISYMHTSHAFNRGIRHGPNLLISHDQGKSWQLADEAADILSEEPGSE